MPDSVSAVGSGGRYTYDENGAGACEPAAPEPVASEAGEGEAALVSRHDSASKAVDCLIKSAEAAGTCTIAGIVVVSSAPTLVGGVVAAFVGGALCGLDVAEAYLCYADD